ncbi:MAG: 50S ribosomal protein L22 [Spirochaetes bacterium]|nr:50S ribosomal protein L22 [Spirochaetota bacterium]
METASALEKYIRISQFKVRRISNELANKKVIDAESYLSVLPNKGALHLKKAIHSARTNYMKKFPNTDEENLYINKILVNQGAMMKRFHPIGRGRVGRILKRSCHIYVEVCEKEGAK